MSYFNSAKEYFESSQSDKNKFIPLVRDPFTDKLSKLGQHIPVGESMYMLLGGNSGFSQK